MSKRIGVVGIDLNRLKGAFGLHALTLSGNNFGNMLFTNAIYNQIPNCRHVGFHLNPTKIKAEFDHIVIPAANWINAKEDWGFLADTLEETDLPICVVGLGSQLSNSEQAHSIPDGTKRFLNVIAKKSHTVAVRGLYTLDILKRLGIENAEALGCPSIFSKNQLPQIRKHTPTKNTRIGIAPTRYILPKANGQRQDDKQRQLYQFAINHANSIYYQSEAFEIAYLNREETSDSIQDAIAYYSLDNEIELDNRLMSKGKYHKDLDQWLSDVIKDDIYIGTRIHGAVAAMLSGTPAILISHDNRTKELAEIMGIPSIYIDEFEISMLDDIPSFINLFDFNKIHEVMLKNIIRFKKFYENNGLTCNL